MSAIGFLAAPLAFDFARSLPGRLDALDWARVNGLLAEMEAEGAALLASRRSCAVATITHRRAAEMRYVGQGHEVRVPLPPGPLDPGQRSRAASRRSRPSTSASTAGSARRCRWKRSPGASSRPGRDPICGCRRAGGDGRCRVRAQGHAPGLRARAGRDDRRCRSTTATGWDRARPSPVRPSSRSANRRPSSAPARRSRSMTKEI